MSERNNIASTNDDREREVDVQHTSDEYKCFVGGIGYVLDDKGLKEEFSEFGAIEATIMVDKFTGKSRGFGFVIFPDEQSREAAINNKRDIEGRSISVTKAVPKSRTAPGTPAEALAKGETLPRGPGRAMPRHRPSNFRRSAPPPQYGKDHRYNNGDYVYQNDGRPYGSRDPGYVSRGDGYGNREGGRYGRRDDRSPPPPRSGGGYGGRREDDRPPYDDRPYGSDTRFSTRAPPSSSYRDAAPGRHTFEDDRYNRGGERDGYGSRGSGGGDRGYYTTSAIGNTVRSRERTDVLPPSRGGYDEYGYGSNGGYHERREASRYHPYERGASPRPRRGGYKGRGGY